jgi:hypothetical protein
MEGQKPTICGTWKIKGEAAQLVIDQQNEYKEKCPTHRGKFSKEKTIEKLLCELWKRRQADQQNKAA